MDRIDIKKFSSRLIIEITVILFLLLFLLIIKTYSYALFHSLAEIVSAFVFIIIFILIWNLKKYFEEGFFIILGVSSLFVGVTGILHLLAYKGVGLFPGYDNNLPTQLWLTGRYLFSSSLLLSVFFARKKVNANFIMVAYTVLFIFIMVSIFYLKIFPESYNETTGLTFFKIASEYVISGPFFLSIIFFYLTRKQFDRNLLIFFAVSSLISITSELCFTVYHDPYSNFNLAGHMLQIISIYLIYRAVIQKGLRYPFDQMFKNIVQKETELKNEKNRLQMYLDNSAEIVVVIGANQKIEMMNKKGRELLGYKETELIGMNWHNNFLPDEIREEMKKEFLNMIDGNPKSGYHESSLLTRDKNSLIIAWHYSILKNDDGDITGILGTGNNITEKKGIDDRIVHLASFPELNINPICEIDTDLNINYLNPFIRNLFPDIEKNGITHPWFSDIGKYIELFKSGNKESFYREIKLGDSYFEQNIVFTGIYRRIRIYGHDISRRKKYENEIRRSEERFRLVLDNSPIAVSYQDLELKYTWIYNSRLGYSQNDVFGKREDELLPVSTAEVLMPFKRNVIKTKTEDRTVIKVDDGSSVSYFDIIASPLLDANNNCEGVITIGIDITKERLSEESRVLSKFCIDKAADGFIWLTPEARIIYANEKACSMYGYTQEELRTMTIHDLAPSFEKETWPDTWKSIKQHGSYVLEGKHASKSGNVFPVEVTVNYIKFEDREFNCSIIRDITERKKMEELIRKAHNDLEELVKVRTEELSRQSNLLEAFFMHSMTSLVFLDRNLKLIRYNKSFSGVFKNPSPETEVKNGLELFPLNALKNVIEDVIRSGKIFSEYSMAFSEDEETKYLDTSVVPIFNEAHEVEYIVLAQNDVTGRIRMEKSLKESEEMFRTVLENLPIGVWIVDRMGRIIHGNPAGQKIWEGHRYVPVDQYGEYKGWWLDTGKLIEPEEWAAARAVTKGETSINEELEIECFDSSKKIISNSALPLKNAHNEVTGAIILNEDITERKSRENGIITTNSLLQFAAKSSSKKEYLTSVISFLTQKGKMEFAGLRLIDEKGMIPYSVHFGFDLEYVEYENDISMEKDQCICTRMINELPGDNELPFMTEGGSFYCNNSLKFLSEKSPFFRPDFKNKCLNNEFGSVLFVPIKYGDIKVGLLHFADKHDNAIKSDFVELVESQVNFIAEGIYKFDLADKIKEAEKELLLAKRLSDIGTLAATVAHELRNPLAAIRMAAYNIKNKAKNPDLEKHILNIDKKVSEGDQIIKNLLFYTRIKTADCQHTDLYELIDETIDSIVSRYHSKVVNLKKNFTSLKGNQAFIDPLLIKELLENIINNSYDAVINKEATIEINACVNGGFYDISVIDNGCGIDKEDLSRIFEPFFTTKSKGTGLGLSVCKQIVSLHHGDIGVESARDAGTRVWIRLPSGEI